MLWGVLTVRPKLKMGCVLMDKDIKDYYLGMKICMIHLCTLISIVDMFIL